MWVVSKWARAVTSSNSAVTSSNFAVTSSLLETTWGLPVTSCDDLPSSGSSGEGGRVVAVVVVEGEEAGRGGGEVTGTWRTVVPVVVPTVPLCIALLVVRIPGIVEKLELLAVAEQRQKDVNCSEIKLTTNFQLRYTVYALTMLREFCIFPGNIGSAFVGTPSVFASVKLRILLNL